MSRCTFRSKETGVRCGFRAEVGRDHCRRCQTQAIADRLRFDDWMQQVVWALESEYGLHPRDLPDCPYADWHGAGIEPEEAAVMAIERASE